MFMKQLPEVVNGYIREASKIILWLFVIAAAFIFLLHVIRTTPFTYPLDYGEAPLVDQARRLAAGENIYRADLSTPPYTITNYPPLYPLLLSPFANGSPFQMGRLISALGAAAAAVFLGLIIYTLTTNRLAALAGSALFLAIPYVVHWSGLARVDLLALGLAMAGLFVLVRWPNGRWGLIG
jgi:4-amino-4-deoxy-L-arabinose transferase-like glycosyltransferase